MPSVPQPCSHPKPALFDICDDLECDEHIVAKAISLVLAKSKNKSNPGNGNRAFSFVGIRTFFSVVSYRREAYGIELFVHLLFSSSLITLERFHPELTGNKSLEGN